MSNNNIINAGEYICPACCTTNTDGSPFKLSRIEYHIDESNEITAYKKEIKESYDFDMPNIFPDKNTRDKDPRYDMFFDINDPDDIHNATNSNNRSRNIVPKDLPNAVITYNQAKCPDCKALLDIPDFGKMPTIFIGNLGATSTGKTSLYASMREKALDDGRVAGISVVFCGWTKETGVDSYSEDRKTDLVARTHGVPEYRYIYTLSKDDKKIMIIYRDFAGEDLGKNQAKWAPWLKNMNVLLLSIDPVQLNGAAELLESMAKGEKDDKIGEAFGDRTIFDKDTNVAAQNKQLRDFLSALRSCPSIDWKKTRLQIMLTKSNKLRLICRQAAIDGKTWPLSYDSRVFELSHAEGANPDAPDRQYYPSETLSISRILMDVLFKIDPRLYNGSLKGIFEMIRVENNWPYFRVPVFCTNGLCFGKDKDDGNYTSENIDYTKSTRVFEQMLWTVREITGM